MPALGVTSGNARQPPAQLLERALFGFELRGPQCTLLELPELERESLDPPNEPDKFTSLAVQV